jgi:hypothetical protein
VLKILIRFFVKYEIPKNISVFRWPLGGRLLPTKQHNNITKTGNKLKQIFNYVHKKLGGHQATCEQNHGMEYGSLQTCFRNPEFSNEKLQSMFENDQVIWTNTLNWIKVN